MSARAGQVMVSKFVLTVIRTSAETRK